MLRRFTCILIIASAASLATTGHAELAAEQNPAAVDPLDGFGGTSRAGAGGRSVVCADIIIRNLPIRVLTGGAEGDCLLFWGHNGHAIERVWIDHCSLMWATNELSDFIRGSQTRADGWISFYWGETAKQLQIIDNPTPGDAITASWRDTFQANVSGNVARKVKQSNWTVKPC
jgi:hypothetical protein